MERERLDLLMKDPSLVDASDLPALRELVDRHPWFSGAHLLLAAGEQSRGDVLADGTVQRAAAHIPSRQVLFDLVHAAPARRKIANVVPGSVPGPEPPASAAPAGPPAEEFASPEDALPAAERVEEVPEPVSEPPVPEVPDDALTGQYEEAILAGGYLLERDAPEPEAGTDDEVGPVDEPHAPAAEVADLPEEPAAVVATGTRMRFSDWLATSSPPVAGPPKEAPAPTPAANEQGTIGELIDRFIQSQTPPPAPKATFFKPQEAAKRSLDDEAGLVTETLAKLYAAQGNTAKAIDAYHRLALKHPEKSSYFAALAKALEDKTSH